MSVNIYSLRNPITNEIIYVGKTIYALNYRLNHHYTKLHECQKGKRNYTPLFKYLENLLPTKVTIELIEEVEDSEQNYKEKYYINSNHKQVYQTPSLQKAYRNLANKLKSVGANGLINLKVNFTTDSSIGNPQKIVITGMAIKK